MPENKQASICEELSAADLFAVAGSAFILDVRSPLEFETEHIANSVNLPLDELSKRYEEVPRKSKVVLVCRSGKRAERAAHTLMGQGFQTEVLSGGILAWRQAGLPLLEGKKMLAIERQIQIIVGAGVLTGVILGLLLNPLFFIIPAFFGAGLLFAGLSGICALGLLLMKAPWNQLPAGSHKSASANKQSAKSNSCCRH